MKNPFIITLLCLSLIGTIAKAQTKKPTTTKKPSTTVKSTAPKTTTKTSTTTTIPNSSTAPVVVEEKKATTTTTTSPSNSMNSNGSSSSTTIQQSSGPSKGGRKPADPKADKVVEPKPEKVVKVKEPKPEKVREPKPEKVKSPRSSSGDVGSHFGIKAGANNLFFLSSGKISGGTPDFSIGFHGGIVGNFGLSETIAIQAEALYVQQSAKFSDGADNATFTGNGIEIPLALQFNFGEGTKFFINAGGYANYELSSSYSSFIGGVTTPSTSGSYTGVSFGDRTGYGAIFGLGVKFNQALFIEARGNYSLKDGSFTDAAGKKVVPVFAGLSLGYFF
jgi:hypothetical protein